ncbi:MAG: hypothetical protein GY832_18750 [Chloroflexi bacterium]|nr:hypothetical protein [Chloroflexota bacterium]
MERDLIEEHGDCPMPEADLHAAMVSIARDVLYMPCDQSSFRLRETDFIPPTLKAIWKHCQAGRLSYAIPVPGEYWLCPGAGMLEWLEENSALPEPPLELLNKATPQGREILRFLWNRGVVKIGVFHDAIWPGEGFGWEKIRKAKREFNRKMVNAGSACSVSIKKNGDDKIVSLDKGGEI